MLSQDCAFSPSKDEKLAIGLVNGDIHVSGTQVPEELLVKAHDLSCNSLQFESEDKLLSGSTDRSILSYDLAANKAVKRFENAHSEPVSRVRIIDAKCFASGDDLGAISCWDLRQKRATQHYKNHTDYISGLEILTKSLKLVACSGDGSVTEWDLRKNKLIKRLNGNPDDSLESMVLLKKNSKIVCGTLTGALDIFSLAGSEERDSFPGHPASVDAMARLDEDTVITGCGDGVIRVLSVLPNKFMGVVGELPDEECTSLALSYDCKLLASTSSSTVVRLWNLDEDECEAVGPAKLDELENEDEENTTDEDRVIKKRSKHPRKKTKKGSVKHTSQDTNFFRDLV